MVTFTDAATKELRERLIAPGDYIKHADALKLDDDQIAALKRLKREARQDIKALKASLREQTKELVALVDDPSATDDAILRAADALMETENRIKRRQLTLVLDARAVLDEGQRAMVLDYVEDRIARRKKKRAARLRRELEKLEADE